MKKALRSILSLAILLALPTTLTAQVTTFDNKLITISQKNTINGSSTPYYLSASDGSNSAAWSTTCTIENIFLFDATNKKLVSIATGKALQVDDASSEYAKPIWSGAANAEIIIYASTNTDYPGTYNIRYANGDGNNQRYLGNSLTTSSDYSNMDDRSSAFVQTCLTIEEANTFMRIRSVKDTSYYLADGNTDNRACFKTDKASSAETIFYYDGTHLTNYYSGFNLANNGIGSGFVYYNGEADGTNFGFIRSVNGGDERYNVLYQDSTRCIFCDTSKSRIDGGSSPTTGQYASSAYTEGYQFTIETVTSLPVTVSSAGYATFVAPVPVTIPSDVEAYTFDETPKTGYVKVRQVSGTIPANFGIYIKAKEGTYNFTIASSADEQTSLLTGNIRTKTIDDTKTYIFANKNSKVGFYLLNPSGNRQVHGSRAYYQPTDQTEAVSAFIIDEGSVTGIIDAIATDATDSNIYDLQGRRIATPTKGLYIKGGKKIYVK